jgi:hypothetical protein
MATSSVVLWLNVRPYVAIGSGEVTLPYRQDTSGPHDIDPMTFASVSKGWPMTHFVNAYPLLVHVTSTKRDVLQKCQSEQSPMTLVPKSLAANLTVGTVIVCVMACTVELFACAARAAKNKSTQHRTKR